MAWKSKEISQHKSEKKTSKNTREIHKKMMKAKRIYWKNRAKRWANLGDGNPKFFHTIATQSYKRDLITSINAADGTEVFNHKHKATIIWNSFQIETW
jgi:hypothetical protein